MHMTLNHVHIIICIQILPLQDYVRIQTDNLRTFDVVAQAASFLGLLVTDLSAANIDNVTQTLVALSEISQVNRLFLRCHGFFYKSETNVNIVGWY